MARSWLWRARSAAARSPQRPSGGSASVDLANQRQEKGKAEHRSTFALAFDCLFLTDRLNRQAGQSEGPRSKLAGTAWQNRTYGIMGDIKKKPPTGSTGNVLNLYLNYIRPKDLFDKRYPDELNDKQGEKNKEKVKIVCVTTWGPTT